MRCDYCEWRCELGGDTVGVCRMLTSEKGEIRERFPNTWSTYMVSRIESTPFYHAYPGSRALCVGTMGCNFRCRYCVNGYLVLEDPETLSDRMFQFTPEEMTAMAQKLECDVIVFNVNEPTVSLPTVTRLATAAGEARIPMGCLTNAYATAETTEVLAGIFSFFNIGLKGFSASFHRKYIGIPDPAPIFRNIKRLAQFRHVEITTPVIQGVNDSEMEDIAAFIADIDPQIPWHVFRLLPEHDMKAENYPSIDDINRRLASIRKQLKHVYFHNFVGSDWVNTRCPDCQTELIERFSLGCGGDRLNRNLCVGNRCHRCGHEIRLLTRS
ncbi:MAG: radical SAM protein [Pseudomonadota bacterium]